MGDYSVHGCEFLLIHQPDSAEEDDEEPLTKQENENDEEFRARFLSERVYRGRLEAIKLTGDPNVPRGEYTFVVEDLGSKGFIGVGRHPPFQGARIVKSQGHVAGAGFASGELCPTARPWHSLFDLDADWWDRQVYRLSTDSRFS